MISRQVIHPDIPSFSYTYSPKYERISTCQIAENGSLKRVSVVEVYDPAEDDKQFCYRDFSLSNVLALGNPSLLQSVQMHESKSAGVENLSKFNKNVQAATQKAQEGANK